MRRVVGVVFFACGALRAAGSKCDEPAKRVDCSGNEHTCEAQGCCWKPVNPNPNNEPWCFKSGGGPAPKPPNPPPVPKECKVAPEKRQDCSHGSQGDCEGAGCCWVPVDPNPSNVPWCFGKGGGPAPSPPGPAPGPTPNGTLPGCQVYSLNQCQGNEIVTSDSFEAARWFTPAKGEEGHIPSYQDFSRLVAHTHVVYSDSRQKATVEVVAKHKDATVTLSYVLGGQEQSSAKACFSSTQTGPLTVVVKGSDGAIVELEPVDFYWNVPGVKHRDGDYRNGQKGAIVELFGWPHADVEKECPHLAAAGYLGVRIFPTMEQLMATEPFQNFMNPWYFMYQPVSYRLQGRMGTRDELRKMIATCRSHGVRVYADTVVNHMTGGGNDANPHHRNPGAGCAHWGNKTSSLPGGHSPMYTQSFVYTQNEHTGKPASQEFPGVPYGPTDFHCERALNSWTDPLDLNAGWLSGLVDLNTEKENVQARIAAYFTDMIGIGFSGFRIDAAKHIKPDDLVGILSKFRANMGGELPADFFTWLEVLLGGEADLLMCNKASGYNYGEYLAGQLSAAGFSASEVLQVKTWNSGYPKEPEKGSDGCTYSPSGMKRQVIQNDDHDQQNPGSSSRDMQSAGCVLIKDCDDATHRAFEVKLFSYPPGSRDNDNDYPIRMVLSSFYWGAGGIMGMPDGLSSCDLCKVNCAGCKSMPYTKAYSESSIGYDKGDAEYTRVHRDAGIINAMRSWMHLSALAAPVPAISI